MHSGNSTVNRQDSHALTLARIIIVTNWSYRMLEIWIKNLDRSSYMHKM